MLSVVIPTLDAAASLGKTIEALGDNAAEIVVVDGGSADATTAVATTFGARVIVAPRGRGAQIAAGIRAATGEWLLLLHADTQLSPGWQMAARDFMAANPLRAGYFRFALDSRDHRARRLERWVAWRCRVLALPYGDQGLLLSRALLEEVGGVRPLPLMEDVDLVRRLGRHRVAALDATARTSALRWEHDGWYRRSARNLLCLSLYVCGMPLGLIAKFYAGRRTTRT